MKDKILEFEDDEYKPMLSGEKGGCCARCDLLLICDKLTEAFCTYTVGEGGYWEKVK